MLFFFICYLGSCEVGDGGDCRAWHVSSCFEIFGCFFQIVVQTEATSTHLYIAGAGWLPWQCLIKLMGKDDNLVLLFFYHFSPDRFLIQYFILGL